MVVVEEVEELAATEAFIDDIRQIEFDAMSPSDQALQILAGADPAGVARRRVALEQSAQLKKALEDAKAFQERMNAPHS